MIRQKINSVIDKISNAFFDFLFKAYKGLVFSTIRDLKFTMNEYIPFITEKKLISLRKYKVYVPKRILARYAAIIHKEYCEISDNKEYVSKSKQNDKYTMLVKRHELLRVCGILLSVNPNNEDILDFLKRSRIAGDNILSAISGEMKAIELKISELKALNSSESKGEKTGNVTIDDYYATFVMLSKNGYAADIDMPVLKFIQAMKAYKKEVEETNKELERIKSKK